YIAVRLIFSTSNATTKLMELRKTKTVGIFNDHNCRIGDVDAHFDNRGCHQDVQLLVAEIAHDLVFIGWLHSDVQEPQAQAGEDRGAKTIIFNGGSLHRQGFGFFDQGTDNKSLAALLDLLGDQIVGFVAPGTSSPAGDDLLSTWRELIDD